MRFAPEVHEVNVNGTKKPIKSAMGKKVGTGLRNRLQEKLNFMNQEGQFNTLADQQQHMSPLSNRITTDHNDEAQNLQIGTGF